MTNFDFRQFYGPEAYDAQPILDVPRMQTPEELEETVKAQWANGQRLEAMEAVLGRRIDARGVARNSQLSELTRLDDTDAAYTALISLRQADQAAEQSKY